MSDYLEILDDAGNTLATIPIDRDIVKLGRLRSAHVRLEGENVSRMHAVIERTERGVSIIDLGSGSGTHVNDNRVNEEILRDGDVIKLGERQLRYRSFGKARGPFRFEDPSEPAREAPACPRCRGPLSKHQFDAIGGYRDKTTTEFRRCHPCAISIVGGETIRARYEREDERLGGTMLERDRRASDKSCPHCPGELVHLTLAWEALWVEVEECPRCGTVVMDDGEGAVLDGLLRGEV